MEFIDKEIGSIDVIHADLSDDDVRLAHDTESHLIYYLLENDQGVRRVNGSRVAIWVASLIVTFVVAPSVALGLVFGAGKAMDWLPLRIQLICIGVVVVLGESFKIPLEELPKRRHPDRILDEL
ncbi:hypothetical protein ACYOEI_12755 [Singulisphaera rosea]